MEITFDPRKRATNLDKHGFDFAALDMAFFNRATIVPAKGDRLMAIGRFADGAITVVFRPLGSEALAVISMRIASRYERTLI